MRILQIDKNEEIVIGSEEWKEHVLGCEPFEGDYFDGVRLSDKIVIARNTKKLCNSCFGTCKPGTYNRLTTESENNELRTFRFCESCCNSMAFEGVYEGNIWIDSMDDEEYDAFIFENEKGDFIEPVELWEYIETVSEINRKHLKSVFGKRWQESLLDDILHKEMLTFETKADYHSEWYKRYTESLGE
jgi:hypothetical protein